jgi:ppGpp synthetase/RelA/SpoT-type nucleotidyltranferase
VTVKYAVPQFPREQINAAGRCLIDAGAFDVDLDEALAIINNWRAAHLFPMTSLNVTLRTRARKIDTAAIVAQRLKRLSSIETKLKRFPKMKLSQMQDLGGCRAVLKDVSAVDAVVKLYSSSTGKNRTKRHEFVSSDDYIRNPKLDGYRSYHLVYRVVRLLLRRKRHLYPVHLKTQRNSSRSCGS